MMDSEIKLNNVSNFFGNTHIQLKVGVLNASISKECSEEKNKTFQEFDQY